MASKQDDSAANGDGKCKVELAQPTAKKSRKELQEEKKRREEEQAEAEAKRIAMAEEKKRQA